MAPVVEWESQEPDDDDDEFGDMLGHDKTLESEKSIVKVARPSRLVSVLEQGGVAASLRPPSERSGDSANTVGAQEESDMELLMKYYGFAPEQLDEELYPEQMASLRASKERHGILLLFLRLNSNPIFTWWCFLIILANSIFMGFQADAIAAHARGELASLETYRIAESTFIGWFIAESVIRCLGSSMPIYQDRFLMFDIAVIALSAVELWILKPLDVLQGGLIVSFFAVFRVLRLTRAVKLVRAVELFRSLYTMLQAVWQSKMTFLSVVILLFGLILVTALLLMSLLGPVSGIDQDQLPPGVGERFSSIQRCMLTLLETLLRGEEWGPNIVRPLLDNSDAAPAGVICIIFAAFGQFFLLNLISGIFIEAMFKTVKVNSVTLEHEHIYVDRRGTEGLRNAFLEVSDGRRLLTWPEFSTGLAMHPDLVMQLGINLELAEALFHQLAYEATDSIHIDEFIFGLIKLTRQSKTIDMLVLDYQQQRAQKDVSKLARRFTVDMERLQLSTHKLARRLSTTLNDCQPLRGTLKARLKRQIERVHRNTVKSHLLGSEVEDRDDETTNDAASHASNEDVWGQDAKKDPAQPPFLTSWLEVLGREGRPRIRHELEASLGGLLAQAAQAQQARPTSTTLGGSRGSAMSAVGGSAARSSSWTRQRDKQSVLPDLPTSTLSQP